MLEKDLLLEAARYGLEVNRSRCAREAGRASPASVRARLADPAFADAVRKVRNILDLVPAVRKERVREIRRRLQDGGVEAASRDVADRLLEETILNELL